MQSKTVINLGIVKGVPFVNRRYMKGVLFSSKMVLYKVTGLDLGVEPPHIKHCCYVKKYPETRSLTENFQM